MAAVPFEERNSDRNRRILAMRGKKSMGLIAKELGLTRNVVAGVFFRADHPPQERIPSRAGHSPSMIGSGYRAPSGPAPARTLLTEA